MATHRDIPPKGALRRTRDECFQLTAMKGDHFKENFLGGIEGMFSAFQKRVFHKLLAAKRFPADGVLPRQAWWSLTAVW